MKDKQRRRWHESRERFELVDPTASEFAKGGPARQMDSVGLRVVVLPGDPLGEQIRLSDKTESWFEEHTRQLPSGGRAQLGMWTRATTDAMLSYSQNHDDKGWNSYIGLLRSGGVDAALDRVSRTRDDVTWFSLTTVVDVARSALSLSASAIGKWKVPGPFELTVAMTDTENGHLGGFAHGSIQPWPEPRNRCVESNLLLRWESDSPFDVDEYAARVGERIENAFGTTMRRFDPPQQN